jgi:hypothetical protein
VQNISRLRVCQFLVGVNENDFARRREQDDGIRSATADHARADYTNFHCVFS